jgi:hypothetical protein
MKILLVIQNVYLTGKYFTHYKKKKIKYELCGKQILPDKNTNYF